MIEKKFLERSNELKEKNEEFTRIESRITPGRIVPSSR